MGGKMSYPMLTAIVLSIFAIYAVIVRRHLRARPLIISGLVMMTLTLIFDNVIIGTGIVAYDQSKLSGIMLGYAPIEDFAYTLVALVLTPSLYEMFRRR
ncbi:MAG: lycopene cyclase domain-containing protein [Actinobacteria bacterium]|nr:lycopene cyclase domain-containing protein [Actinomycetota bacterium]